MANLEQIEQYLSPIEQLPLENTDDETVRQFFQMQPETAEDVTPTEFPMAPVAPGPSRLASMSLAPPLAQRLARAVQAPGESVGAFFERREREAGLVPSGVAVAPAARAARPAAGPAKDAQNFLGMQTGDTGFGLTPTRADFAGIADRGGQEQKITGVPTRTADTATGQTVEGAAPVVKAEMKADAKAQAAGAGGDEGTDNLALGELLARGIGSVYQGATGRELGGNIPEMLSALRQRREAQKLKEQELAAEQARQDRLFQQQRGLKALEIGAEEAKDERRRQALIDDTNKQIDFLAGEALRAGRPEDAAGLESLRGLAAKGTDVGRILNAYSSRLLGAEKAAGEAVKTKFAPARQEADIKKKLADADRAIATAYAARRKAGESANGPMPVVVAPGTTVGVDANEFAGLGLKPAEIQTAIRTKVAAAQEASKISAAFAPIVSGLKAAEAAAANVPEMSTGEQVRGAVLGALPGGLGERFKAPEQRVLDRASESILDILLRAKSGAAITDSEFERLSNIYAKRPFRSVAEYKQVLKELKREMHDKLTTAQAAYAKTGNVETDRYAPLEDLEKNRGFISFRDPYWQDMGRSDARSDGGATAPTNTVRMFKDGKAFDVPAANVDAAKQRGYTEGK